MYNGTAEVSHLVRPHRIARGSSHGGRLHGNGFSELNKNIYIYVTVNLCNQVICILPDFFSYVYYMYVYYLIFSANMYITCMYIT